MNKSTRKRLFVATILVWLGACDFSDSTTELGGSDGAQTEAENLEGSNDSFGLPSMQLDGISMLDDAVVRDIYYLEADSQPVAIEYLTLVTPDNTI